MNRHLLAVAITGAALGAPGKGNAEPSQQSAKPSADWFASDPAGGDHTGEELPSAAQTKQEQTPVTGGDWFESGSVAPSYLDDGASLSTAPLSLPQYRMPSVAHPKAATSHSRDALVPVHFEADDPSVRLLAQDGEVPYEQFHAVGYGWYSPYHMHRSLGVAPVYAPICDGPCTALVPKGPHQLALAKPGSAIVPVGTWSVSAPSLVRAQYIDRSNLRTAGAVVGVVGVLTGMVLMVAAVHNETDCGAYSCITRADLNGGLVAGGFSVFAGSIVASVILLNQRDRAVLSIAPMVGTAGTRTDGTLRTPVSRLGEPQGVSASVRF